MHQYGRGNLDSPLAISLGRRYDCRVAHRFYARIKNLDLETRRDWRLSLWAAIDARHRKE